MNITKHAQQRIQQRGLSATDLEIILTHGTETRGGYYLRRKDTERVEVELKKLINQLHRLTGKYVVVEGNTVITAYHPGQRSQKNVLRNRNLTENGAK